MIYRRENNLRNFRMTNLPSETYLVFIYELIKRSGSIRLITGYVYLINLVYIPNVNISLFSFAERRHATTRKRVCGNGDRCSSSYNRGRDVWDDRRSRLIALLTNYNGDFLKNAKLASFSINEVTSPMVRDRTVIIERLFSQEERKRERIVVALYFLAISRNIFMT